MEGRGRRVGGTFCGKVGAGVGEGEERRRSRVEGGRWMME